MPNSIIVLLFIQKIFTILAYILEDFLLRFDLFLGTVSRYKHFFFADTPQKVHNIHRTICFAYSCISFVQFFFSECLVRNLAISSLDSRKRNFFSSLVNKRLGGRTLKRD